MIRTATAPDQTPILSVALASGLFEESELGEIRTMLDEHFAESQSRGIWVVDVDDASGTIVGVGYVEPERMTDGTFNLLMIAVQRDRQKQGRGTAILAHVEWMLSSAGGRVLLVETMGIEDFQYVRSFYRKNGFVEEARIRDFYFDGADKIVFWKSISTQATV